MKPLLFNSSGLKLCMFLVFIFASSESVYANKFIGATSGELIIPAIFSDNMVVQQNDTVAIWGKAMRRQPVIIETSWGEIVSVEADANGDWSAMLATPYASFESHGINVQSSTDAISYTDVLVGEVWLCSGQSNMYFRMQFDDNSTTELSNADAVPLRLFQVPTLTAETPQENIENAQWETCSATSLENFSAVAYYFGKNLLASLDNTPVGLINASFGSSSIEAFMSKETLLSKTYLADHYNNYITTVESKQPSACYNAMIHPLIPYAIKGMAWYQGESNCVRASHYYEALEAMIAARRNEFGNDNLPFYIVQLPPYDYSASQQEPGELYSAATLREAQFQITNTISNTGLVVTTDIGDVNDLHPTHKKPVGERLANLALNQCYGQTGVVYSGPKFKSYAVEGETIRLTFDFADNGYVDTFEELNWFTIAGSDKKFYQGNAFADGNGIVVSSPFVKEPQAVRFAWYNTAVPNFFSIEGLPASPFKTDDWTDFTYASSITSWSSMPDIRNVPFELRVPELTEELPAAGKRVKQTLAGYEGTNVYHTLYLPTNWEAGKEYPVIVEYAGNGPYLNKYGDVSSGKPDGVYSGYGIGGGEDFIWIGMPFVSSDGKKNQLYWWGDIEASVEYTINTVNQICANYGGNSSQVFVAGFSRGAIACNYIGLHNDEIANLWCGSIANSHYDGVITTWGYPNCDKASALVRLQRLNGKPQLIIQEGGGPSTTKSYIDRTGVEGEFTYMSIPYRNHDLRWVLQDIPQRARLREWVKDVIEYKALVSAPNVVEPGQTVDVSIELKGSPPWQLSYKLNDKVTILDNINTSPYTFKETINDNTSIGILSVSDVLGRGTAGDSIGIYLLENELTAFCDGMVRQTQKDGIYSTNLIEVKHSSSWNRRGLYSFGISGFEKEVAGAALKLFLNKSSSSPFKSEVMVFGLSEQDFTCNALDWNTALTIHFIDTDGSISVDESHLGTYITLDVGAYLNQCIQDGQSSMVLSLDLSDGSHVLYFNANEHTENQAFLAYALVDDDTLPTAQHQLNELDVLVYPNPANEFFFIENPTSKPLNFSIYNVRGQLFRSGTIHALETHKIEGLMYGLYLLRCARHTEKIFVKN